MRHAGLAPADCAYVLTRHFAPDPDDPVRARLALPDGISVPLTWRVWQVWGRIAALDRQVKELLQDEEFALYVPHLDLPLARVLYTNRRCREVSFLEEGLGAYSPMAKFNHPFSVRDNIVRYLYSRGRYPAMPYYVPTYAHAYCLDATCFPDLPRKTVLPLPFKKVVVAPDPSGHVLLVLDALIEFGIVAPDALRDTLHEHFARLGARGQRRVLYKYHPVQAKDPARRAYYETEIFGPWRDRLTLTEFTAPVASEDLAFSYPMVEFVVIFSSVGLYARLCGRRVECLAWRLAALEPSFAARLDVLPPAFVERVEIVR